MKLTSIEIHPANSSQVVELSFRDPNRQNPYSVVSIAGLDAGEITPRFYGVSGASAENFNNLTVEKREIIIKIQLRPDFSLGMSVSDLRDALYKIISSSRTGLVQLQFKDASNSFLDPIVRAVISGFVSKVEPTLFEKQPAVDITISVPSSMNTMLVAPDPVVNMPGGFDPVVIEDFLSTAPHGVSLVMNVVSALPSLIIRDDVNPTAWAFTVTPAGGFLAGDVIHVSSEPSNKQLYVVRGGVTIYLADVMTPGSIWPVLFPGPNHFDIVNGDTKLQWVSATYYPTYWGV